MSNDIRLWFDGACWPNPGGRASYGWAVSKRGYFYKECSGIIGKGPAMSNNVAEYTGLYEALKYLKENNLQNQHIKAYGDSKLVVEQMSGRWRVKKGLYVDAFKKAFCMKEEFSHLEVIWIPREKNGLADSLSKKHLGLPPEYVNPSVKQFFDLLKISPPLGKEATNGQSLTGQPLIGQGRMESN